MRKAIIIVSLLLIVLLALAVFSVWYISAGCERLCAQLPALRAAVERENWNAARLGAERLCADFERQRRGWEALINHDDMRDIEVALVGLRESVSLRDHDEALQELAELDFFISHIAETEKVDLGNIL